MKRCPKCEFIYEDDQTCCDMDGIDLVFDHNSLPATGSPEKHKPGFRRSLLVSIVGVVFGVVAMAIGYASLERAFSQTPESSVPPATVNQPTPVAPNRPEKLTPISETVDEIAEVATSVSPAESTDVDHKNSSISQSEEAGTQAKPLTLATLPRATVQTQSTNSYKTAPQPRVATVQPRPATARSQTAESRKDSKVVSLVKKTGRFLTKPFKR